MKLALSVNHHRRWDTESPNMSAMGVRLTPSDVLSTRDSLLSVSDITAQSAPLPIHFREFRLLRWESIDFPGLTRDAAGLRAWLEIHMEGDVNSDVKCMVVPAQTTQVGCACAREEEIQPGDFAVEETEASRTK